MTDDTSRIHTGSCLCGAVRFEVAGDIPAPDACHCSICRKFSGHYFASADVPRSAVTIHGGKHVRWYQSSERVRRGFCVTCGASLFFDAPHKDWLGIAMGAFDGPTHTRLAIHIFVSSKGDYYDIADGLPQHQSSPAHDPRPRSSGLSTPRPPRFSTCV